MEAQKIIITGGATRIGAAIARSLSGINKDIVIHYNKSKNLANKLKKELEDLGSNVFLIKADLNNANQVRKLIKDAFNKMKGLDCLINNASVFENDNLTNLNDKSFSKHMNVNLKAPALLTQNFKKYVKKNYGIIINIIDQRIEKLTPYFLSYTLSKSALGTLTVTSAMKLAPNIRVNAISAGPIKTLAASAIGDAKFLYKWNADHSFLKRNVDNLDVGNSALYLLSDMAGGVTGEIHYVDAGYNKVGMPDPKNIT